VVGSGAGVAERLESDGNQDHSNDQEDVGNSHEGLGSADKFVPAQAELVFLALCVISDKQKYSNKNTSECAEQFLIKLYRESLENLIPLMYHFNDVLKDIFIRFVFRTCTEKQWEYLKHGSVDPNIHTLSEFITSISLCYKRTAYDTDIILWNEKQNSNPNLQISLPSVTYGLPKCWNVWFLQSYIKDHYNISSNSTQNTRNIPIESQYHEMVDIDITEVNTRLKEISTKFEFDVFISYCWQGSSAEVAYHLKKKLEAKGFKVCYDRKQLQTGEHLFGELFRLIKASRTIACCISEQYAESPNCLRELFAGINLGKQLYLAHIEIQHRDRQNWPDNIQFPVTNEILFTDFPDKMVHESRSMEMVEHIIGDLKGQNHPLK